MSERTFSSAAAVFFGAVALGSLAPTVVQAQEGGSAAVAVATSGEYGAHLTDAQGKTLYMFTADKQGKGDAKAVSNCYDQCAQAWPPLLTQGKPVASDRADSSLLGTIQRKDGSMQVTYNGWPLYTFVKDRKPGEVAGQDVHGFGGEWYLVEPGGKKLQSDTGKG